MDDINIKLDEFINRELNGCVEKVERTQGGFVNFTFRIYLKNDLSSLSSLDNSNENNLISLINKSKIKSIIIKIASPFLAGSGQTIPLSVKRQEIEEKALKLFNKQIQNSNQLEGISKNSENSNDLSTILNRNKMIEISKVLFWDEINNILVTEDHGPLLNLIQWFLSDQIKSLSIDSINNSVKIYGENLGHFLVDMQKSSLSSIEELEILFNNSELQLSLSKLMISSFEKMRQTHNLIDADEIASIFIRCFQFDTTRQSKDGQVFSHGDFNIPNFLINQQNSTVAIIDWELARVRSPAHDPALFIARAKIFSIIYPENKSLIYFINSFMDSYKENAKKNNLSWYTNQREQYLFAWYLGVAYGVSMLRWAPTMKCCNQQNQICNHQIDIIQEATKYIKSSKAGPEKITYDIISNDQFFNRLF